MAQVQIRSARVADLPTLVRFNALLAEETERRRLDPATLERGVEALLRDPARGQYFVAVIDAEPVGQMMITYEWSDWRNGMFWWIQSVYVAQSSRGRGVFATLFAHVDALSRRAQNVCGLRLYVEHENERAQAAYRKCGLLKTSYLVMETDRSRAVELLET